MQRPSPPPRMRTKMNGTSDLNELLERQRELMYRLGIDPTKGELVDTGRPSESEVGAAIGIVTEAAEVLDAMDRTKRGWTKYDKAKVDHVKEEMTDVLFFILELAILLGLSGEDLGRLYIEKYNYNMKRLMLAAALREAEAMQMKLWKEEDE